MVLLYEIFTKKRVMPKYDKKMLLTELLLLTDKKMLWGKP